jgi:Cof subfamily protein (haloacid dehalogenase superfamily)
MQYKLLVMDLDDTLLGDDLSISDRNISAIKKAQENGVLVTVATGRATPSALYYSDLLGLELPVISYQGARVTDKKSRKILYDNELHFDEVMPLIKVAEKTNTHLNLFINDIVHIERETEWSKQYRILSNNVPMEAVGKLSEFLKGSVTKAIFIDDHFRLEEIKPLVEQEADDNTNIFFSKPFFLECTNKKATKGSALKFLAEYLNVRREEIIAIGDTYNDISMIEYAGLGVCMSNGPDAVQKISDFVTYSNADHGVAYVIEKFIL